MVDSALIGRMLTKLGYSEEVTKTAYSLLRTYVTTLINMPGVLTMALAMSLVPAISAKNAMRDRESVKATARLGLKLALIIGIPCAVGLFVLAQPIIHMLYPKLTEAELALATDLMHTASMGVIFLSMVQAMTGVVQGLGKPQIPVFNLFIGFVLKVITMLILMNIPSVNIQGAAISTVVCYAYAGVADTIYMMRRTKCPVKLYDTFIKPVAASVAMGLTVHYTYAFLSGRGHGTLATLASVIAGIAVYGILVILLKMLDANELSFIPGGSKLRRIMYRNASKR